jgi:hypothetical protein
MNRMMDSDIPLLVGTVGNELEIHWRAWLDKPKPHGISACIRVRNESQFMRAAVRSIIELVDEVVLCVQPSDDNTREIAIALEQEYAGKVKSYYYPLVPDWIDTAGFYSKDPDAPGHMVHMSNWALSKCTYSWILKVEGDVIALPTLKGMIETALTRNEMKYYGLVILNVAGRNMDQISWENPRNGGWDESMFPNNPDLVRFVRRSKWEVTDPLIPSVCLGWALLHLKRCKAGKDEAWNGEHYIPWQRETVEEALKNYNAQNGYPGPDNPLGGNVLYSDEWRQYL